MKKTRSLSGMSVTEIRAEDQEELFTRLAKFSRGRGIESVHLDYLHEELATDEDRDIAIVVWA